MALALKNIPRLEDDDAIERFACGALGWRIEFEADGTLIVSPSFSDGGPRDVEAALQLRAYADRVGGKVFGSSSGFRLSYGSLRSPDAAWISGGHIARLNPAERSKFWRTCPDVIIEILSESDDWSELLAKVVRYMRNGAVYVVALDPFERRSDVRGLCPDGLALDFEAIFDA